MISSPAISFDAANTNFLRKEISGYHYRKNRTEFSNGMSTLPAIRTNTLSPYPALNDDFFPEMIKNLGFKINPVDKTYEVRYDAASGDFIALNFVKTTATVNVSERKLDIVRNHFHFLPDDYRRLLQLQNSYRTAKQTNRNLTEEKYAQNVLTKQKDRALFWFYSQRKKNVSQLDTTIAHELKHIENGVFEDGLSLKKNSKRQTVENMYRIAVENERSAYLRELVQNINTYLQKGSYGDFSMFHNNNVDFVKKLRRLRTPAERIAYATNWPQLLAEKLNDFELHHRKSYDYDPENVVMTDSDKDSDGDSRLRQFLQTTKYYVKNAPLNAQEDTDGTKFKKLRSLFYNYKIYNPTTHRMEDVNLAQYITPDLEVKFDDRIRREIIEPQQNRLNDRLRDFATERAQGAINTALIEDSKINRFDIHCYGRDIAFKNVEFFDLYNQYSSVFGTISHDHCTFTNFVPVLNGGSYNAFVGHDIVFNDCVFNATEKKNCFIKLSNSLTVKLVVIGLASSFLIRFSFFGTAPLLATNL
jgi:hypothetical protein